MTMKWENVNLVGYLKKVSDSKCDDSDNELDDVLFLMLYWTQWSLVAYVSKDTGFDSPLITADTNKTTAIALKPEEPLLIQDWTKWMDNFCNSPFLARTLGTVHMTDRIDTLKLKKKKGERCWTTINAWVGLT
jgi:hypothetical protein